MSNPTPRKPSTVTVETRGHIIDILVDVHETNTVIPEDLKEVIDRRKRERREKREREAREQGTPPPSDSPAT